MKQIANSGGLAEMQPTYGPLVPACAKHGIGRTTAFELAREGKLDTFKIGARTFVTMESLAALPERLRQQCVAPPVRPQETRTARRNAAMRQVRG